MKCSTNRCRPGVLEGISRGLNQFIRDVPTDDAVGSEDPRMSVLEFTDRYVVECDVPAVAADAISVQIEDSVLSISGKRAAIPNDDKVKVVLNERSGGEFTRRIQLSRDVDQSTVDAELANGVLKLTIRKRPEVLPRKIQIKRA